MSSLISLPHFCTDVVVLGIMTLLCTDVMVQGYYLFIFSSRMDCNMPSNRCGRLYYPNVSVQCGIVYSDVNGLLYCSCHIVVFPAYYFKVFPQMLCGQSYFGVHVLEMIEIHLYSIFNYGIKYFKGGKNIKI